MIVEKRDKNGMLETSLRILNISIAPEILEKILNLQMLIDTNPHFTVMDVLIMAEEVEKLFKQ